MASTCRTTATCAPNAGASSMEKAFIFMARMRVPGGILTPAQWLAAEQHGARTRQRHAAPHHAADHPVPRHHQEQPAPAIRGINDAMLDTIAACGDVNRNVIARGQSVAEPAARRGRPNWRRRSARICCREAAPGTRSGSTRNARRRRGGRRTDLRPHLHAAQIQDRRGLAAAQRRRRVRARSRLHRDRGGRADRRATTWSSAAAWA